MWKQCAALSKQRDRRRGIAHGLPELAREGALVGIPAVQGHGGDGIGGFAQLPDGELSCEFFG